MNRLLILTFLLCSLPSWATIALVQRPNKTTCGAAASCAITITSASAGDALVGIMHMNSHTVTISSVSGACTSGWVVSSASYTSDVVNSGISGEFAYCLNAASGTTVTFTWSATSGSATSVDVYEFSHAGTMQFKVAGFRDQSSSSASVAGVNLGSLGGNSLIVQLDVNNTSSPTAISGGYSFENVNADGIGWLLNVSSDPGPTWTLNAANAAALSAIALTEVITSNRKRVVVSAD